MTQKEREEIFHKIGKVEKKMDEVENRMDENMKEMENKMDEMGSIWKIRCYNFKFSYIL
jgi:hypothetical protein